MSSEYTITTNVKIHTEDEADAIQAAAIVFDRIVELLRDVDDNVVSDAHIAKVLA